MSQVPHSSAAPRHAIVIGGSLSGLFIGNLLRRAGWHVEIFERSAHTLDSRGGGIVLQPDVEEVFRRCGIELTESQLGVRSQFRNVFNPDGSTHSHHYAPQVQTSWSLLYSTLRRAFGDLGYHQGATLARVSQDDAAGTVTAHFADGSLRSAHMLIGADGGNSTVRAQFWPNARPVYAGYLAWRGLVPEAELPASARQHLQGDLSFANNYGSHILGYLVPGPGNDLRPGHRLFNWVWYRTADPAQLAAIMTDREGRRRGHSIPEGWLDARWLAHLRTEAQALLPPAFRDLVEVTRDPFAQEIRDLACDHYVAGRAAILGDAAAIPRPHTAASTLKAAANALALADALTQFPQDLQLALAAWEPAQVALGKALQRRGIDTGTYLMFQHGAAGRLA